MNNGSQGAAGSIPTGTVLDYLSEDINRPDLYEERSFIVKDIHGPSDRRKTSSVVALGTGTASPSTKGRNLGSLLYTIGIIILSAAIFITLVSWSDVLRSWFDTKYVNPIIGDQLKSRIYFATTITIISIIVISLLLWLWYRGTMTP